MKKVLESKVRVRFQDCDPYNHLNNSKYLDYFINAREDQVQENYNLDIFEHIKKNGKGWVVATNQISYLKPAITMEEVVIETQLLQFTESIIKVEMKMWNADKTVLKSIFWNTFVYFDIKLQKKTEHSQDLIDLFTEIVNPIEETIFEKRVYAIIKANKLAKAM